MPDSLVAALVLAARERGLPVLADVGPRNGSLPTVESGIRNAAVLLGEEDEWGSLTPGAAADLIVVEGRPDASIGDTRGIRWVTQAGRRVDRASLEFDPARHGEFRP